MRCARCGEPVEQDGVVEQDDEDFKAGDPVWMADGCYVCEWFTGHDEDGRFSPTHEVDPIKVRWYDAKYNVHSDTYDSECPDCQEQYREEKRRDNIEFVVGFFDMKLGYDKDDAWELAQTLVDAIQT